MKNFFNTAASGPVSEAEQALKDWGIEYKKKSDGSLFVPRSMDISGKGLTQLPDLSSVTVGGSFICINNQLTSLGGAPHIVGGSFFCDNNRLTSLEYAPHSVGRGFYCSGNQLTSLEGAPRTVGGDFSCDNNRLTSLEGAPHTVSEGFYCSDNQLTSLEHAPTGFSILESDFGRFFSSGEMQENLRVKAPPVKRPRGFNL